MNHREPDDFRDEIASHLQHDVDRLMAQGMARADAEAAARRRFGNVTMAEERFHESTRWRLWDELRMDARFAWRSWRKRPWLAAVLMASLALGIGANTAIFSVVHTLLLKELPYREAPRLMYVTEFWPKEPVIPGPPSPDFALWRREARLIDSIAAYGNGGSDLTLTGAGEPERIAGTRVTHNLLPLLGADLALGRNFTAEEDREGAAPRVAILGHALWQRRFNGSSAAIGKAITLGGTPFTVVGVLPPRFRFPDNNFREELLIPMALPTEPSWSDERHFRLVRVVARVKHGVAAEALRAELATLIKGASAQVPAQFQRMRENLEVRVTPLREWLTSGVRTMVWRLAGAVAMVLLIVCLNIAGLQAALAVTRRKEMALRAATGAGRARLIRQLLTESLLLTAVAGAGGVALGYAGVGAIRSYLPENLRLGGLIEVDRGVLLFTFLVTAGAGLITGLLPAVAAARLDVQAALKDNGERQGGASVSAQRVQTGLLMAEVAAAMMLLLGAGLLIRNFLREAAADPGFDARGVFTLKVSPSPRRYAKREERVAFFERLLERSRSIPGVRVAAIGGGLPLVGTAGAAGVSFADRPEPPAGARPTVPAGFVSAEYFRALGIPVVRGRVFSATEPARVAVVNQAFADHFFPGKDPLGQRIEFFSRDGSWREIVGVVGNVKQRDTWRFANLMIYAPWADSIEPEAFLVLKSELPASSVRSAALSAVREIDGLEPVFDAATMEGRLSESLAPRRTSMTLMSLFAALAMLLTAIGLFGAIAYAVNERRREIAIRVALGATPGALLQWVLARGLRVVAAGVGLGGAGMAAMGRWETAVALPAALVFLAIAALACWIPGRRALAVSPASVMREG